METSSVLYVFFFQAEDGIRDVAVTGVQTCALPILDRYFESILKEQSDPEAIGSVTALAERRRTEEIRRSQVKAVVHPVQLIDATVLMQRAEWQLESARSEERRVGEEGRSRGAPDH